MFREAILSFLGVKEKEDMIQQKREQGVGEYCKGADIEECRKYFGEEMLRRVCATCPH